MSRLNDITGKRFGKLLVLEYVGNHLWKCKCDCGNIAVVHSYNLRHGKSKSCRCGKIRNGQKVCPRCQTKKYINEFGDDGNKSRCKSCMKEIRAANWESNHNGIRERQYWHGIRNRYGLTQEDFNCLLESQKGKCAICRKRFSKKLKPEVDHCELNGVVRVRGLLCDKCNRGLGFFNDDDVLLKEALNYLNRG